MQLAELNDLIIQWAKDKGILSKAMRQAGCGEMNPKRILALLQSLERFGSPVHGE